MQVAVRVRFEKAPPNRVVHGVGQDRTVSAAGARGCDLPIHRAGCVVEYPTGRHGLGQRRHRSGIAGDPGENFGSRPCWTAGARQRRVYPGQAACGGLSWTSQAS
jgi:hypothetical protein